MIMALVLLGVLGVSAALALRLVLTGESVSRNRHSQTQALNAAELGLRYCESQIGIASPEVPTWPASDVDAAVPALWKDASNWNGSAAIAAAVPNAVFGTGVAPQCLIEEMVLPRARGADASLRAWLVTARGMSPGWRPGGHGAEVWLQSVVRK